MSDFEPTQLRAAHPRSAAAASQPGSAARGARRYWVVGGDYHDCAFRQLVAGSETIRGPYRDELSARTEWQRLTYRDHLGATTRYTIAVEPEPASWPPASQQ